MARSEDPAAPARDRRMAACRRARASASAFGRAEDGSLVIFGLFLFIGMLMVAGLSVDIMRHDYSRVQLQGTVDAAILAAADLDQTLEPEAVVEDYFDKAGLLELLERVEVEEQINSRTVTAIANQQIDTLFMRLLGFDTLQVNTGGRAREDISDIEISMVLDISGSMDNYGRLDNLKDASKSFVTTVLDAQKKKNASGEVSISVVPYSTQVAVPPVFLAGMNLTDRHTWSNCVNFESGDFSSTALPLTSSRRQTQHFDIWSYSFGTLSRPICRTDDAARMLPLSQDETVLHDAIDALTATGNTSTDIGMKWGAALLDPSARRAIGTLVTSGVVDRDFLERPFDMQRENTMKVMVVMSDGANTYQPYLRDEYSGARASDVLMGRDLNGNAVFSVADEEPGDYDDDNRWREDYYRLRTDDWSNQPDGVAALPLTWQQVWAASSLDYHADVARYRQTNSWNTRRHWEDHPWRYVSSGTKDARQAAICQAAKDAGILVFTVAFEINEADAALMESCASSKNHYFNVHGEELVYAFNAIASTINQLRLVQ